MDNLIHKHTIKCKYCSSADIVKYGTFQGMQRYFCKSCRRKFADNDALPNMKTPVWIISLALNCYYKGMSLRTIQNEINQRHGAYYAQSSIYNWIIRFSKEAVRQAKTFQPEISDRWFLSITPAVSGNRRLCFGDIFDTNSKYLLSTHLFETGTKTEMLNLITATGFASRINHQHTVTILFSDTFSTNKPGLINHDITGIDSYVFETADLNTVKEFHRILKRRDSIVSNFKNINTAQALSEAWQVHYNFITENDTTKHSAPAQKTGKPLFQNWEDIIKRSSTKKPVTESP